MKSAIGTIEMDVLATIKELFNVSKWLIPGQLLSMEFGQLLAYIECLKQITVLEIEGEGTAN